MPRPESTEQLIENVRTYPNPESANFDVKSRRILDSTAGKKKLVRHFAGIANQGGGTILVGVEDDGESDGFSPDSEPVQKLVDISLKYTQPSVHNFFSDEFEEVGGEYILRIDIESSDRTPIGYSGDGDVEFPTRKHDSTRPMTHDDLRRYYENGYEETTSEQDLHFQKGVEYGGIENWYQVNSSSEGIDVWDFFDYGVPSDDFVFSTSKRDLSKEEAERFFAAVQHHFRPSHLNGMFTIAQWQANWFGQGLDNFFDALFHQNERYQSLTEEQRLENHHSESGLFLCNQLSGLLVIHCISERATDGLDRVGVHLLRSGIPVDTRHIEEFMEVTETSFTDARRLDSIQGGRAELPDEAVMLNPTKYWHDSDVEPWVMGMLVKNPFAEYDRLYEEVIGESRFDSILGLDQAYCHLSDHDYHSANSEFDYEYYLKRIEWWDMNELRLPIDGKNIRLVAERVRDR